MSLIRQCEIDIENMVKIFAKLSIYGDIKIIGDKMFFNDITTDFFWEWLDGFESKKKIINQLGQIQYVD